MNSLSPTNLEKKMLLLQEELGYQFKSQSLLKLALIHPSARAESSELKEDNQRLEFLGDAVLQLVITEQLFKQFPDMAEGILTQYRAGLVSRAGLVPIAHKLKLGDSLFLGKGEEANEGRKRPSNLADAMEALIGALYVDSGSKLTGEVVANLFRQALEELPQGPPLHNPKGILQETLQAINPNSPKYCHLSQSGPDHEKSFKVMVTWNNMELGRGTGSNKKEAEMAAARQALKDKRWE